MAFLCQRFFRLQKATLFQWDCIKPGLLFCEFICKEYANSKEQNWSPIYIPLKGFLFCSFLEIPLENRPQKRMTLGNEAQKLGNKTHLSRVFRSQLLSDFSFFLCLTNQCFLVFQIWFFSDSDDPSVVKKTNGHLVNTKCSSSHNRSALCCKMAAEIMAFLATDNR